MAQVAADIPRTNYLRENSRNQGPRWNALISRYIVAIPDTVDPPPAAEHIMSGMPPPWTAASSAMTAKVGVAASDSQPAAPALSESAKPLTTPRDS
jgi:hypothetical protein